MMHRANFSGVNGKEKLVMSAKQKEYITANAQRMSYSEMGKNLDVHEWKVREWVKELGIVKKMPHESIVRPEPPVERKGFFVHDKNGWI